MKNKNIRIKNGRTLTSKVMLVAGLAGMVAIAFSGVGFNSVLKTKMERKEADRVADII